MLVPKFYRHLQTSITLQHGIYFVYSSHLPFLCIHYVYIYIYTVNHFLLIHRHLQPSTVLQHGIYSSILHIYISYTYIIYIYIHSQSFYAHTHMCELSSYACSILCTHMHTQYLLSLLYITHHAELLFHASTPDMPLYFRPVISWLNILAQSLLCYIPLRPRNRITPMS